MFDAILQGLGFGNEAAGVPIPKRKPPVPGVEDMAKGSGMDMAALAPILQGLSLGQAGGGQMPAPRISGGRISARPITPLRLPTSNPATFL